MEKMLRSGLSKQEMSKRLTRHFISDALELEVKEPTSVKSHLLALLTFNFPSHQSLLKEGVVRSLAGTKLRIKSANGGMGTQMQVYFGDLSLSIQLMLL